MGTGELVDRLKGILGPAGSRVPSLRDLARKLRTSPTRVHAAVRKLVELSYLSEVGEKRKRYYVGVAPGNGNNEDPLQGKGILEVLRREVLLGALPPDSRGEYPTIKETAGRLGCSPRSISQAMRRLAEEGVVRRQGKRYASSRGTGVSNTGSSVHIVGPPRILHAFSHGPYSAVSEIERGVLRRGWNPVRFFLESSPQNEGLPPEHMVSSFVYVVTGKPHQWISLLNQFPRIPLIVIDGTGDSKMHPERENCFFVRTSNREAGREVGKTLIERGHRHVAFIPYGTPEYEWEIDRKKAVREVYDAVGKEHRLTAFSLEPNDKHVPTARELLGWSETRIRLLLCSSGFLPFEAVHERMRPLEKLDRLPALMEMARPAFDRAFQDRSITAWVCANDEVSVLAMHYLREKGPHALNRISLVGFDNSPISYVMGISSYEFDFQSMARVALQAIAHPEAVRRSEGQVITLRGYVVVRKSLRGVEIRG